ncbi:ATP-binding cassette domain-containing protein [candidate division GN15 bacterium]|nr:ATP-binding cassette domain-containing protein [candidate division GN15 bacterium]
MSAEWYEHEEPGTREKEIRLSTAFRRLMPFLAPHKWGLAVCLGLLVTATALSLAWPVLIQRAIDNRLVNQLELPAAARDFTPLLGIALLIVAIQAITLVFQYIQRVKLETIGQDTMLDLKRRLFSHILSLDTSFFDEQPVGRLMARIESDCESLRLLFTNTVVLVVGDLLLMFGIYGIMAWYDWRLALILFAAMPALAVMIYVFHRLTTHRFLEVRKKMAEVTATITEFLHGMSIVQIFHRGDYARERVRKVNEAKFKEDAYVGISVTLFFNVLHYIEFCKIGLVLLLGSLWSITAGTIVTFILLIWKEFEPIARASEQLGSFQKGMAGARRIFGLLDLQPKLTEREDPVRWDGLSESIRFEHVWFSYTDNEDWVLKDVDFEIKRGQRFALAGVTGGGKTTVIALLLRLYDPQKGRILVDGIDIRDINLSDLRQRFALVLQDIILFPGSVADNIGLEVASVTRERIESSASTVAADRFIEKLPDRYDTVVSEKGSNFSRGERQLLSFARALAVDPDVLILDEATSSVDPETERTIQGSLKKLMAGRTSLIIAHRLSTILDVDRILVIRRGEIVEQGSHVDLLLQDGYYSRLFHLQFKNKNGATADAR